MTTNETPPPERPRTSHWALPVAVLVLFCTTAVSLAFLARERRQAQDLTTANATLTAALGQVQQRMQAVTARVNTLSPAVETNAIPEVSTAPREEKPHPMVRPHTKRVARVRRPPPDDPRWKTVQDKLSDEDKAIASTREDMDRARQDLQTQLASARDDLSGSITRDHDELSGSIARTHDELVALEKRGERTYIEFQLDKSKRFQVVGPIGLSLRKANTKHRSYNLAMMVEDQQIQKKGANLYEPLWITVSDRPGPVELVVNEIDKNHVKGYLSEPKYKKSELASSSAPDRGPKLEPQPQQ